MPKTVYPSHHFPLHAFFSAFLVTFRPLPPKSVYQARRSTPTLRQSCLIQQRIPQRPYIAIHPLQDNERPEHEAKEHQG